MIAAPANLQREGDMLRSGATSGRGASARSGFMPLALEHVVLAGLVGIQVYLRTITRKHGQPEHQFILYCSEATTFAEQHRQRLRDAGVKFIYIPLQHQMRFRRQVENHLEASMLDPALAISAKAELVYETSIELVNELLTEESFADKIPRLESIAKAVTTLVMNDASAFTHLFAASQHDFYTATHMVNVGTWMVPLAYALGIHAMDELNMMCVAGMVHDIGKIYVSEEVLNKKGKLAESDWQQLRTHPQLGVNHLKKFADINDLVLRVTLEHHERLDGTGYPAGLTGTHMHLASRICAVVDSFDAMTAFRPFKDRTETFGGALAILKNEAPAKYEQSIVDAWVKLMQRAESDGALTQPLEAPAPSAQGRREHERFPIQCPARLHRMELAGDSWRELAGAQVTAHNISRSGLGFLTRQPLKVSQYVRIYLLGAGSLANRVMEGQVVRFREYTDGWDEVGMRFAPLDAEKTAAENLLEELPVNPKN